VVESVELSPYAVGVLVAFLSSIRFQCFQPDRAGLLLIAERGMRVA
jgi:hypothetical protein